MDYDMIKSASQDIRDKLLKQELGEDKVKILEKHGLSCNENLYWERIQDKYPTQEYFSHKFVKKSISHRYYFSYL